MGLGSSSEKKKNSGSLSPQPSSPNSSTTYTSSIEKIGSESPTIKKGIPIRRSEDSSPILIMSPTYMKSPPIHDTPPKHDLLEVPTVFNWNHGGQEVYLIGTFTNWQEKITMRQSHNDFTCIQGLPPGLYHYRYIVDGKWQTDPSQPMETDSNGEVNNIIEIKAQKKEDTIFGKKFVPPSPPGSYAQDDWEEPVMKNSPPMLPPHLLRALLNTAPLSEDSSQLPLPHHVMLNHVYSLPRKDDKMILIGVTQRYKKKFVTTVMYKPLALSTPFDGPGSPDLSRLRIDSSEELLDILV